MTGWTWVEPFAGAAACALRLVGGRDLSPPVAWMGGKRRYARAILDAMGVPDGPPSRVLLADAGPWGWVWPLLLAPESASRVAAVLRSWAGEHPRDLWQRLAAQPPAEDLHERAAAQWLWLQARSASGVPIWWDGWRLEAGNGKAPTDRGEDLRWPAHQAQRAAWLASDGRGEPRPPGSQADHATGRAMAAGQTHPGRWEKGNEDGRVQPAGNGQRGVWRASNGAGDAVTAGQKSLGGWRMGEEKGTARGQTGGLVDPCTIAARVEAIALAFADVDVTVHHGDVRELEIPKGAYVYDDPRASLAGSAPRSWRSARPCDSRSGARGRARARPPGPGSTRSPLRLGRALELTREGGKPEWLTLSRPPARLPERQADLFAPSSAPKGEP